MRRCVGRDDLGAPLRGANSPLSEGWRESAGVLPMKKHKFFVSLNEVLILCIMNVLICIFSYIVIDNALVIDNAGVSKYSTAVAVVFVLIILCNIFSLNVFHVVTISEEGVTLSLFGRKRKFFAWGEIAEAGVFKQEGRNMYIYFNKETGAFKKPRFFFNWQSKNGNYIYLEYSKQCEAAVREHCDIVEN